MVAADRLLNRRRVRVALTRMTSTGKPIAFSKASCSTAPNFFSTVGSLNSTVANVAVLPSKAVSSRSFSQTLYTMSFTSSCSIAETASQSSSNEFMYLSPLHNRLYRNPTVQTYTHSNVFHYTTETVCFQLLYIVDKFVKTSICRFLKQILKYSLLFLKIYSGILKMLKALRHFKLRHIVFLHNQSSISFSLGRRTERRRAVTPPPAVCAMHPPSRTRSTRSICTTDKPGKEEAATSTNT